MTDKLAPKGRLVIIAGPSGSGKGSIKKLIFSDKSLNLAFSVSATTRTPRSGERPGIDYFFVSKEEFIKLIEDDKFIEYAEYSGNYYGTLQDYVQELLNKGKNVLLEIEIVGVRQIIQKFPDTVTIFLLPPSLDDLRQRLEKRGTDTPEQIKLRLEQAKIEMLQSDLFKYVVINQDLDRAASEVIKILKSEL